MSENCVVWIRPGGEIVWMLKGGVFHRPPSILPTVDELLNDGWRPLTAQPGAGATDIITLQRMAPESPATKIRLPMGLTWALLASAGVAILMFLSGSATLALQYRAVNAIERISISCQGKMK